MDSSRKKGKPISISSKSTKQSSIKSESSDFFSDQSRSQKSERRQYKDSSNLKEPSSSVYTEVSEIDTINNWRKKNSSSIAKGGGSSGYSGTSRSRRNANDRYEIPSSSTHGASSVYTQVSENMSEIKEPAKKPMSFMKPETSVYVVNKPETNFQTAAAFDNAEAFSDFPSSDQGAETASALSSRPQQNIQLMPFKVKDVMEMIKDNPAYKDKSPVMIKVKENDIDQILQGKQQFRGKAEPLDKYLQSVAHDSPISMLTDIKEGDSFRMSTGAESGRSRSSRKANQRAEKPFDNAPFTGANTTQKIYAMPDIQAYPMIQNAPSRKRQRSGKRQPTPRPGQSVSRTRSRQRRRPRSRPHRRPKSRPSRRRPSPDRSQRRGKRRAPYRRGYYNPCTNYPMCEDYCPIRPYRRMPRVPPPPRRVVSTVSRPQHAVISSTHTVATRPYDPPFTADNRGYFYADSTSVAGAPTTRRVRNTTSRVLRAGACCCNLADDKLKFIQPGLCNKRKSVWTNEYAVIPKPQVHLIDPCEELDPTIYPRADNPCIRDGQGNPLTDCIGRPLRSPIGKRFLNFSANGSVLETSIRGNFWTGQPPLCVKCPMPNDSCGQDTTHNWWMSCGYPIMSDMTRFYKQVLTSEFGHCS